MADTYGFGSTQRQQKHNQKMAKAFGGPNADRAKVNTPAYMSKPTVTPAIQQAQGQKPWQVQGGSWASPAGQKHEFDFAMKQYNQGLGQNAPPMHPMDAFQRRPMQGGQPPMAPDMHYYPSPGDQKLPIRNNQPYYPQPPQRPQPPVAPPQHPFQGGQPWQNPGGHWASSREQQGDYQRRLEDYKRSIEEYNARGGMIDIPKSGPQPPDKQILIDESGNPYRPPGQSQYPQPDLGALEAAVADNNAAARLGPVDPIAAASPRQNYPNQPVTDADGIRPPVDQDGIRPSTAPDYPAALSRMSRAAMGAMGGALNRAGQIEQQIGRGEIGPNPGISDYFSAAQKMAGQAGNAAGGALNQAAQFEQRIDNSPMGEAIDTRNEANSINDLRSRINAIPQSIESEYDPQAIRAAQVREQQRQMGGVPDYIWAAKEGGRQWAENRIKDLKAPPPTDPSGPYSGYKGDGMADNLNQLAAAEKAKKDEAIARKTDEYRDWKGRRDERYAAMAADPEAPVKDAGRMMQNMARLNAEYNSFTKGGGRMHFADWAAQKLYQDPKGFARTSDERQDLVNQMKKNWGEDISQYSGGSQENPFAETAGDKSPMMVSTGNANRPFVDIEGPRAAAQQARQEQITAKEASKAAGFERRKADAAEKAEITKARAEAVAKGNNPNAAEAMMRQDNARQDFYQQQLDREQLAIDATTRESALQRQHEMDMLRARTADEAAQAQLQRGQGKQDQVDAAILAGATPSEINKISKTIGTEPPSDTPAPDPARADKFNAAKTQLDEMTIDRNDLPGSLNSLGGAAANLSFQEIERLGEHIGVKINKSSLEKALRDAKEKVAEETRRKYQEKYGVWPTQDSGKKFDEILESEAQKYKGLMDLGQRYSVSSELFPGTTQDWNMTDANAGPGWGQVGEWANRGLRGLNYLYNMGGFDD